MMKLPNRSKLFPLVLALAAGTALAQEEKPQPSAQDLSMIQAAAPEKAPAAPQEARQILVFSACPGFYHESIPWGTAALEILGEKTGAFETVVTDDPAVFDAARLKEFDGIVFNNFCGNPLEPAQQENVLNFVREGGGFIGIHCGVSEDWLVEMSGTKPINHPWNSYETATITVEEPEHPVVSSFGRSKVTLNEEIYQMDSTFSRENLRVLLSLDTSSVDMTREIIARTDGDFALAWVRTYGDGRVFYTALGHNKHLYWNAGYLGHLLAGIQFAVGDLDAPATPREEAPAPKQE